MCLGSHRSKAHIIPLITLHHLNLMKLLLVSVRGFKEVSPETDETSAWIFQALDTAEKIIFFASSFRKEEELYQKMKGEAMHLRADWALS